MTQFTKNLFFGSGEAEHQLEVIEGQWPSDIEGSAYVIGPDKHEPGGHWLAHHGYIYKIDCKPMVNGRIGVLAKRVNTPVNRLRNTFPKLFAKMSALEISPFGISNLANTNLQVLDERMFVGYDVGRPLEVDPETLEFVSPVGANDEWLQAVPAFLEPQISVAAHPAADYEKNLLYFVNYSLMPDNQGMKKTTIGQWDMEGKVKRWPIANMPVFDTIHDIKSSRNYLVFTDLPFIVEPRNIYGKPRRHANQDICQMWIVDKKDLEATHAGEPITAKCIRIDKPSGHIKLDVNDDGGILTVYLQHIPATDLGLVISPHEKRLIDKQQFSSEYEGMISVGPQPNIIGKYRIDVANEIILGKSLCWDKESHWNSLLWTDNIYSEEARGKSKYLWSTCLGFDPEMVLESAFRLYENSACAVVSMKDLPKQAIAPSINRVNLDTMCYDDAYSFEVGTFAHPPIFIPKVNAQKEDDGYIMVFLNKDKPKQILLFDAANLSQGPVVRVSGKDFNPPVMLHTTWKAPQKKSRSSKYKISLGRDMFGAAMTVPATTVRMLKHAKNMNRRFEVK